MYDMLHYPFLPHFSFSNVILKRWTVFHLVVKVAIPYGYLSSFFWVLMWWLVCLFTQKILFPFGLCFFWKENICCLCICLQMNYIVFSWIVYQTSHQRVKQIICSKVSYSFCFWPFAWGRARVNMGFSFFIFSVHI
jgi:hypothetical protein